MPDTRNSFKLESAGALTVGANKDRWIAPFSGHIVSANAVVGTAPTGAALVVDVLKEGVSVFGSNAKPTVAISGTESDPATGEADQSVSRFVEGDTISLSVTQVGSTVAGSDLDVVVQFVN